MRVYFERSGGFAGMLLSTTVNTDSLPNDEALYFQTTIEESGFFDIPDRLMGSEGGADRFHYRLTVEASGREHTVEFSDSATPEALRPLVERLTNLARSSRG
jgi:hypothetical protein